MLNYIFRKLPESARNIFHITEISKVFHCVLIYQETTGLLTYVHKQTDDAAMRGPQYIMCLSNDRMLNDTNRGEDIYVRKYFLVTWYFTLVRILFEFGYRFYQGLTVFWFIALHRAKLLVRKYCAKNFQFQFFYLIL